MHRLAASVRLDLRLQMRNGFYYAVAFVLVCWFVVLTRLPAIDWGYVLPAVVFGNLVMVNFYFVAGLVLLEKGEGTLEAQVETEMATCAFSRPAATRIGVDAGAYRAAFAKRHLRASGLRRPSR